MYEKGVWEYDAGHLAEAIELEAGPRGAAIQGSDVEESPDAGRVSLTSAG
jgi:hypothetical protein